MKSILGGTFFPICCEAEQIDQVLSNASHNRWNNLTLQVDHFDGTLMHWPCSFSV
uniref:Uncharacterized protein LOC103956206 isoform X2 n=1 Tax=Rhizophora mucronata TaxID=61149 RepID=A0A2P2LKB6_RHIMU